jgi:xylan 1,4-beta-xylosidase
MSMANQLQAIDQGFRTAASFPELRRKPIIIGESDPEGCAACSVATNPENAYRNGTMYSSYTAAQIARTYELADLHGVNLRGSVTWAFEFEDQPYFAGFRDLATNGIDKPVLNVFRMLGQMGGDRVSVESTGARALNDLLESGVREQPDVNALASRNGQTIAVLVWNYHDDDVPRPPAAVDLSIEAVPAEDVTVTHYRVDERHSNSYAAWKRMGSPQPPTAAQIAELQKAGQLQELAAPSRNRVEQGTVRLSFELPAQAVSLVRLTW